MTQTTANDDVTAIPSIPPPAPPSRVPFFSFTRTEGKGAASAPYSEDRLKSIVGRESSLAYSSHEFVTNDVMQYKMYVPTVPYKIPSLAGQKPDLVQRSTSDVTLP